MFIHMYMQENSCARKISPSSGRTFKVYWRNENNPKTLSFLFTSNKTNSCNVCTELPGTLPARALVSATPKCNEAIQKHVLLQACCLPSLLHTNHINTNKNDHNNNEDSRNADKTNKKEDSNLGMLLMSLYIISMYIVKF